MKKIITVILSLITLMVASATVSAYDGKQVIVVRNTEKHGLYITVGGTKIYCDKTELPFIDENNRTQVAVRAISNAFGKKVIWHESAKVVKISTYGDKEGDTIEFAIGSDEMTKNGEKIKMDTKAQIVDCHTYVPLRYLGEALNCDVEYTEADRFADIIVTRTSDFAGFNQTDSITVWGNIESAFHEGGGLGSIRPFEGEEPDLNGTMIRKYNVVFMSQEKPNEKYMEVDVYWDTLYNKTYAKIDNVLYSANESFPRFLDSLLESGEDAIYVIDETDRVFLLKHGWNINYKISSITETLPQFDELGEFSAKDFYYLYNNELSKDAGLDMSLYAGKDVTVEIYNLRESMPEKFRPIDTARGIIVKFENQIIGAYISSGRHQVEIACSLSGKDFKEITQKTFDEYIAELLKEEASLKLKTPEDIIKLYFDSLSKKDEKTAALCISKTSMFSGLTANILNTELYNDSLNLPLTNKTFIEDGERRIDNVKSVSNLEIKPFDDEHNDDTHKSFVVTLDIEYEKEETISNGNQYWICDMVYESENTGWKIVGFGH